MVIPIFLVEYEAIPVHHQHTGHAHTAHSGYEYAPVYYPHTAYGPPKGGN